MNSRKVGLHYGPEKYSFRTAELKFDVQGILAWVSIQKKLKPTSVLELAVYVWIRHTPATMTVAETIKDAVGLGDTGGGKSLDTRGQHL